MPEDGFLNDIVTRWRAQSHAPEAVQMEQPTPLAAAPMLAPGEAPPAFPLPGAAGLRRPATPAPRGALAEQQSLAALIRQFRS